MKGMAQIFATRYESVPSTRGENSSHKYNSHNCKAYPYNWFFLVKILKFTLSNSFIYFIGSET